MKKLLLILISLLLVMPVIFAEELSLDVAVNVPDDYQVNKPTDAISIDHFVLELEEDSSAEKVLDNRNIEIGNIEDVLEDGFNISFLYYGNLSDKYTIKLKNSIARLFTSEYGSQVIPLEIMFLEADHPSENIQYDFMDEDEAVITILPTGPVNGMEVFKIHLALSDTPAVLPGEYTASLVLELEDVK